MPRRRATRGRAPSRRPAVRSRRRNEAISAAASASRNSSHQNATAYSPARKKSSGQTKFAAELRVMQPQARRLLGGAQPGKCGRLARPHQQIKRCPRHREHPRRRRKRRRRQSTVLRHGIHRQRGGKAPDRQRQTKAERFPSGSPLSEVVYVMRGEIIRWFCRRATFCTPLQAAG